MTYFLAMLVLGVWGLIIYKIFKATGNDDTPVQISEHVQFKEGANDYALSPDTTHLMLNYRDPFSDKKAEPVVTKVNERAAKVPVRMVPKPALNWNFIKYSGFILNPGSKRLVAILNINGKELMMSEGETVEQVKLVKNLKDSVKVIYQGNTKFITLNNHIP